MVSVKFINEDNPGVEWLAHGMDHIPRIGDFVEIKPHDAGWYRRLLVKAVTWNVHPHPGGTNYNVEIVVEIFR